MGQKDIVIHFCWLKASQGEKEMSQSGIDGTLIELWTSWGDLLLLCPNGEDGQGTQLLCAGWPSKSP